MGNSQIPLVASAASASRGLQEGHGALAVQAGPQALQRCVACWGQAGGGLFTLDPRPNLLLYPCHLKKKSDYITQEVSFPRSLSPSPFLLASLPLLPFSLSLLPFFSLPFPLSLFPSFLSAFQLPQQSIWGGKFHKDINPLFSEPAGFYFFWPKIYLQLKELVK